MCQVIDNIIMKGENDMNFLTIEEAAKEVGRSPYTLQKHWKRTRENLMKNNIIINRYGSGKTAKYTVSYKVIEE